MRTPVLPRYSWLVLRIRQKPCVRVWEIRVGVLFTSSAGHGFLRASGRRTLHNCPAPSSPYLSASVSDISVIDNRPRIHRMRDRSSLARLTDFQRIQQPYHQIDFSQSTSKRGFFGGLNRIRTVRPLVLKIFQSPSGMKGNGRNVERRAIYQLEVFLKLQPGSVDTGVEVLGLLKVDLRLIYLCLRLLKNIAHKVHPVENSPECAILSLTKFLGPALLLYTELPEGNQYLLPASQVGPVIFGQEVLSKIVGILLTRKFPPKLIKFDRCAEFKC